MTSLSRSTVSIRSLPTRRGVALVKRIVFAAAALWHAQVNRREVTRLLRLDDRMLKDIGLVRSDVIGALAERATVDPSRSLRLRSDEQRERGRTKAVKKEPAEAATADRATAPEIELETLPKAA